MMAVSPPPPEISDEAVVDLVEERRKRLLDQRASFIAEIARIDGLLARLTGPAPLPVGRPGKRLNSRDVIHATATYFRVPIQHIIGIGRHASIARVRHIAMYLARQYTAESTTEIGLAFQRDHTTVCAAVEKIAAERTTDADLAEHVAALSTTLSERTP